MKLSTYLAALNKEVSDELTEHIYYLAKLEFEEYIKEVI